MGHSDQHSSEQQKSRNVLQFVAPRGHRAGGEVEFRNVSFQDTANGQPALTDISFYVRPGTRVGIVGPSGSGKINLLNLLTRFHAPSNGAILLDGKLLHEYELAGLRRQFSIMPRDPMLWATTVEGNIACDDPQASRADVVRAARLASAHEFIEALPQGYDTMLGEGGAELSPGERQRLAIARAFLKDAPMLVLDEPDDTEDLPTEQLLVEALDRLMAGRTSFTIAHRISTLECCDMVLVLKNGALDAVCTGDDYAKVPRLARPAPGPVPSSVPRLVDLLTPGPVLVQPRPGTNGTV